tara:strand:- start:1040 stop:1951 length:912 start_codon:yes stop_codon:yes gene_type:complete
MAFSVNQPNFNGKDAGFFISQAMKEIKSLDYMTLIEGVKYKTNIQQVNGSGLAKDADCTFTSAGNLALTERTITPKNLKINLDICRTTLMTSWNALQMRAGVDGNAPSFEEYVISYMGQYIAESTENSIWRGNTATSGEFTGFITGAVGLLLPGVDANVVQVAAAASPFTAGNIISNLGTLTAAIPAAVYTKEDLYIYMNAKSWKFYIEAVSALNGTPFGNMNDEWSKLYNGIKLAVCPGMGDDELVAAQSSNMYMATDTWTDASRIQLLDMGSIDGSDNIRCVAKWSAAVEKGTSEDVVRCA